MNKQVIKIQDEINPHFKSVWQTKVANNILKGGRNSFKSSVIVLLLVYMMIPYIVKGEQANIVVIRKVGNTIRDSVFNKIQWALRKFFIMDEFKATVAPFRITHVRTGSSFYFYGQDDFAKLKSNDINNIIAVWYEEAAEFDSEEEFDQTNVTFMRQKHPSADEVKFFWSYNLPRNPYSWINEWAEKLEHEEGYLVHSSSYLDDELGFVTPQMLADIERIKKNDYDYYRYIYLGEPVGLGMNVYNIDLFKMIDEIPKDERVMYLYYAVDGGHSVSATTCLCLALTNKGNVILIDTYYYSPQGKVVKKAPSDLSIDLNDFIKRTSSDERLSNAVIRKRTIDSAEAAIRNQYYKDFGQRWNPVAKKKKIEMIDYVHALLAQGRFYYVKKQSNEIFIEEHKRYQFKEETILSDNPQVVKDDDHTCDAFQYFVIDNARDLKLKV